MTNGNRKGGAFERQTSRELSLWASYGRTNQLYDRSSNSGGKASRIAKAARTRKSSVTVYATGDIVAVHPDGAFLTDRVIVEAKDGYESDIKLPSAFWNQQSLFWTFVSQAERASLDRFGVGYQWWLIFHQNHKPTWLFTSEQFTQHYVRASEITHVHVDHVTYGRIVMYDYKSFLEFFLPEDLASRSAPKEVAV